MSIREPKFDLGQVVITRTIKERCKKDPLFLVFVHHCLMLYYDGDWGDVCEEDKQANDEALRDGERILAAYHYLNTEETIWIITEWDRTITTILYPDEY